PADATTINYAATGGTLALTLRGSDTVGDTITVLGTLGGASTTTVQGNGGNDTVNVQATAAAAAGVTNLTVSGGAGDDTVNVGSPANQVGGVLGPVSVAGDAGANTLNVNDQATTAANTYTLTATTFQRSGTAIVTYATIQTVTLNAGAGGDTVNVL